MRSGSPFVGRESELAELVALLDDAVAGVPRLALVGGEAGIGKSRLVGELRAAAEGRGARVLVGSCVNFGTAPPPYLPVIDALRAVSDLLDDETLCCFLPDLGDVRQQLTEGTVAASSQARLFEQLLGTFQQLAELGPVVLLLEDVHWADPSTFDLLSFLVRNVGTAPILLAATYRTDELHRNHPLRPVLAELRRHRRTSHLELGPFGLEQVRVQLEGLLDEAPKASLVNLVFERSDGIPFFVEELADTCSREELPSSVQHVLSARLDGLDDLARSVVEAAAVAGALVPHPLLARVSGLPEAELAAAVREAIAAAVLVVGDDGRSYRFRHALLREVVVADMLPGDRIRHHGAVAEALVDEPGFAEGGPSTVLSEQAWHWRMANRMAPALAASIEAGRAAERIYAFQEALAHHEAALELWDAVPEAERPVGHRRVELLGWAAEAAANAGQLHRAVALSRKAVEAVPADEPLLAGRLATSLAQYLRVSGRLDESIAAGGAALERLPPGPSAERARALAVLATTIGLRHGLALSQDLSVEAAAMAAEAGDAEAEGLARDNLGVSLAAAGDFDRAVQELERSLELARQAANLEGLVHARINLVDVHMRAGRHAEGVALADLGDDEIAKLGVRLRGGLFLAVNAAECEIELGRHDSARARLTAVSQHDPTPLTHVHCTINQGYLALRTGDLDEAERRFAEAEPIIREMSDAQFGAVLLHRRSELALWRSRPDEAAALVELGLAESVATDDPRIVPDLLALGARAAADAGVAPPPVADPVATLLARAGQAAELPCALAAAEATRRSVPDPDAWAGVAALAVERPFHAAYARWREAEALLATGRRPEATDALRLAHALALQLGAPLLDAEVTALARRARLELDVDAVVPVVVPAGSPLARFGLTPREEEVLALVGDGLSNREIGERLFINVKTASVHVSNILAKLGVGSRVQAATLASRLRDESSRLEASTSA